MPRVTVEISEENALRLSALHEARYGPETTDGVVHHIDDVVCSGIGCVTDELPKPTYDRYMANMVKMAPRHNK